MWEKKPRAHHNPRPPPPCQQLACPAYPPALACSHIMPCPCLSRYLTPKNPHICQRYEPVRAAARPDDEASANFPSGSSREFWREGSRPMASSLVNRRRNQSRLGIVTCRWQWQWQGVIYFFFFAAFFFSPFLPCFCTYGVCRYDDETKQGMMKMGDANE